MSWELKDLQIGFQEWGDYKGKHTGKITFQNGNKDAFTFTLSPDECKQYLAIIAKKVGIQAGELGAQIIQSMEMIQGSDIITILDKPSK